VTKHEILLCGYIEDHTSNTLSASEFYVINCSSEDTLLFFGALQNCKIQKNHGTSLSIIETKDSQSGGNHPEKHLTTSSIDYLKQKTVKL
jgi:hypothetical protein